MAEVSDSSEPDHCSAPVFFIAAGPCERVPCPGSANADRAATREARPWRGDHGSRSDVAEGLGIAGLVRVADDSHAAEQISRLVGHSGTTTTETVYRKQIRPVLVRGADAMDLIFPTENHAS